eukprot:c38870_g1_i1 orf=32-253(+)
MYINPTTIRIKVKRAMCYIHNLQKEKNTHRIIDSKGKSTAGHKKTVQWKKSTRNRQKCLQGKLIERFIILKIK